MKRFESGRIFITPGALEEMQRLSVSKIELLGRHHSSDWSELTEKDKLANGYIKRYSAGIFSSRTIERYRYEKAAEGDFSNEEVDQATFWFFTKPDTSATTILLPSEY